MPRPDEEPVLSPAAVLPVEGSRRTMAALSSPLDVFETFFEQVGVGLALADLTTRFVRVNDAYAELLGQRPEYLVGESFRDLVPPGRREVLDVELADLVAGQRPSLPADEPYIRATGVELHLLHSVKVVRGKDGAALWFALSAQDITQRHLAEQKLQNIGRALAEQAVRDPLTGLANRTLLEERLRGALSKDARLGTRTGVLFLDLDGFKAVNDRYGHGVGDDVLRQVAQRLLATVRPSDTVARMGGDEFVVLVEGVTDEGLGPLAGRLEQALRVPLRAGPRARLQLALGVSVGSATSSSGDADAAGLLSRADAGMYEVKRHRRT